MGEVSHLVASTVHLVSKKLQMCSRIYCLSQRYFKCNTNLTEYQDACHEVFVFHWLSSVVIFFPACLVQFKYRYLLYKQQQDV
jgi:hypothetical protein